MIKALLKAEKLTRSDFAKIVKMLERVEDFLEPSDLRYVSPLWIHHARLQASIELLLEHMEALKQEEEEEDKTI